MAKVLIGNFKGPQGEQGVKGDPGTAATIQVGTTQTVQPEENAEVTNTGTTTAAVLNFKIPRGEDGMTDLTAEYKDASEYTCQPTVNAPVVIKEVDGKTEQVETTGVQLLDMENYDFQTSGCTVSKSSDYSVFTATGADAYFGDTAEQGMVKNQGLLPVSPNTEYTVTISNNYFTKNYISFLDSNKTGIQDYLNFTSQSQSFTTPSNCSYIIFRFGNANSVNGDTERFQIMFNKGPTALPWEPYTGGSPAPSPDYPQAIKGVGGMGYFDGEWVQGNISSTGTVGTETTGITSANAIPCKQNDNIAVTYEDSIDVIVVAFYNASGAYISTSTSGNSVDTFTATAPANAASFKVNLRVVSGSTITPNGAKYCTVTINGEYQTGVEVTGKNLCPPVSEWIYNSLQNRYETKIFLKGGKKYYASSNIPEPSGNQFVYYFLNTGNAVSKNYTKTYTPQKDEYIDIYAYMGRAYFEDALKGTYYMQVEEGESPTDYQPYHHTTLSIPLTSPLYEGDKICYVKPGDKYVNADGETVVADGILYGVYRENAEVVFDGSEDESWEYYGPDSPLGIPENPIGLFGIATPLIPAPSTTAICNNFASTEYPDSYIDGECGIDKFSNFYVVYSDYEDTTEFKTWLSTHPTEVVYKLAQPYFEPFADQSIFYDLRTDDILTYVYSNDPIEPNVTVEVAKNSTGGYLLESYAQAQKNAISEADNASRLASVEQQLLTLNTTVSTMGGAVSDLQTNTYALSGGTAIPKGADMDNYKNVGNYYCSSNSVANALINCPFKEAFTLKIEFGVGTGYPRQTFRNFNTGEIATRYFNGDSNMWGTYSYLTPTKKE